jgi:hypothetical protein
MSLPQMVQAFIFTSTCPWPGLGMGTVLNSTVLFPGRYTPCIVLSINRLLNKLCKTRLYNPQDCLGAAKKGND